MLNLWRPYGIINLQIPRSRIFGKEMDMGKDLKGKELGVGLYQRKDGRYEAKATIRKK